MNNERVTFYKKLNSELNSLPIKSGQIIFVTDEKKLYLDKDNNTRIQVEGLLDNDDVTKLNGIESGAQVNIIETLKMNGTALSVSDKTINITSLPASILTGAIKNGVTATTQSQGDNSTKVATTAYVDTAIENLAEPMIFKGSLGTGGTITSLPTAASSNEGFTYKVITAGTYAGQAAKVGDVFISDGTQWIYIPSADEPSGTVTSITISGTSPISVTDSGTAIITSGSRTISHATSGVTAGSYGDNSNQTPDYGGSFKVPYISVNNTGHVTTATEHTVTLPNITSYFGTCDTIAATAEKTVVCSNFSLTDGARIDIKFTNNNTTTTPQLNVNNTGAKSIYPAASYTWKAGEVVSFVYYNNSYYLVKGSLATTSYYGITKLSNSTNSTSNSVAATPSAVKAAYDLADTANTGLSSKQDTLVSGTSIKTINNTSLLGSGNISLATSADIPTKVSDLDNDSGFTSNTGTITSIATSGAITGGTITTSGTISHSTAAGYKHIPSGGSSGQYLKYSASGTAAWTSPDTSITSSSTNTTIASSKAIYDLVDTKQPTLVSGTNIKTINNESILGSGNISISGGGATITVDDAISNTSENPVQNKVIYTALSNKVDAVSGKGLSTNDYTTTEKNKLSGIATGAQVNVIETVKVNNTALTPSSKAVNITVPTKVSDLTNDSGYTTNTGTITGVSANGTSVATSGVANIPAASTSAYGVTQLSSSTSSTSTTLAATPSAVKSAYDRASTAINNASTNATAISNIKDGTNLDSFGDVESALANKADSSSVTSQINNLSDEIYSNCELVSHKSTSISSSSTNTQYPTAKAVYDYTPMTYIGTTSSPLSSMGKDGDIYFQIEVQ